MLAGVLVGFGAFALLISIVAAFANGAHSHQVLSAATWKQLGTGGGIVTGLVLFAAWGAGGFIAARLAGRDGVRHGVWVFIVGVLLITIIGAAITWLPDTTAILRNLRLLGLPVRRNEWRDFGTVAGIASILGMAAGSVAGGWWAERSVARAPATAPAPVPVGAPPVFAPEPEPTVARREQEEEYVEPAFAGPSLFEPAFEPEPEPEPQPAPAPQSASRAEDERPVPVSEPGPADQDQPAWLQFVEERQAAIRRDREYSAEDTYSRPEPAPWAEVEPAPEFIEEPEGPGQFEGGEPAAEPVEASSWWPGQTTPAPQAPSSGNAWALPDDEEAPVGDEHIEGAAFPHPPATPGGGPEVVDEGGFAPPPAAEHAEWAEDETPHYQSAPEPGDEHVLQDAPEAPLPEIDDEEREARRRQQEEAARAYEQLREEQ